MYTILEESEGRLVGIRVSGTLTADDYHELVPLLEQRIDEHGSLCILFEMKDFHGWKPQALWEDLKFDVKHNRSIDHAALIGDKQWEAWMTTAMKPFAHAETRYFDASHRDEAWAWLRECAASPPQP